MKGRSRIQFQKKSLIDTMRSTQPGTVIQIFILCVLTILLADCDGNYRNVELVGQILDRNTNKPVVGARATISWWVYDISNTAWESKPVVDSVKTNLDGKFKLKIKKAEAYDLVVKHPDYVDYNEAKTLDRNLCRIQVYLEHIEP